MRDARNQARELLDASEQVRRFREMFVQSPSFSALLQGPEHRFVLINPAYQALIGHRDVIGLPIREAIPRSSARASLICSTTSLPREQRSSEKTQKSFFNALREGLRKHAIWISSFNRLRTKLAMLPLYLSKGSTSLTDILRKRRFGTGIPFARAGNCGSRTPGD